VFESEGHFEDREIEELFDSIMGSLREYFYQEGRDWKIPTDEKIIKRMKDEMGLDPVKGVKGSSIGGSGPINIIPTEKDSKGTCCPIVVVFCFSKNKLHERLRELVYHLGIYCRKETTRTIVITNQWDNDVWQVHLPALEILRSHVGIRIFKAQLEGNKFIKSELRLRP